MNFRIELPTGVRRNCTFKKWCRGSDGAGKSLFLCDVEGSTLAVSEFSMAHGRGTGKASKWRIVEEDLEALRAWAKEQDGRIIGNVPYSTGRKRIKRAPKVDPRQKGLFE